MSVTNRTKPLAAVSDYGQRGPHRFEVRETRGGGHCGFLDRADLIGIVCGRPSLDAEVQRAHGRVALTAWLRGEAMADAAAREKAWRAEPADGVTLEVRGRQPT